MQAYGGRRQQGLWRQIPAPNHLRPERRSYWPCGGSWCSRCRWSSVALLRLPPGCLHIASYASWAWVLGAVAQFEKAVIVSKLKAARVRKRRATAAVMAASHTGPGRVRLT